MKRATTFLILIFKSSLIIICLLLSFTMFSQKIIPEPETDTYTINNFNPNGNGFILSNLNFSSEVVLKWQGGGEYKWLAKVSFKSSDIEGYIYNGIRYSKNELKNDFGISSFSINLVYLGSVIISFENGKSFKNNNLKMGRFPNGAFDFFDYYDTDDSSSFKIKSIRFSNASSINIESSISIELTRKEHLRKNNEIKKQEEERAKKKELEKLAEKEKQERLAEEKRQAEILEKEDQQRKVEKNITSKNIESEKLALKKIEIARLQARKLKEEKLKAELRKKRDQEKMDEDSKNAAVRRRMAERREKERKRKKREFDKSVKRTEKSLAKVFSLGIMSAMDNGGSIKIGYGIRSIEDDNQRINPTGASTLELGYGLGKIGLSIGYSLFEFHDEIEYDSDTRRDRGSGGTWVFGMDFTAYEFNFLNSDSDIGINVEYGFGKIEHKVETVNKDWQSNYASNFYSIGLQLKFLNFLYVSYNYGLYKTTETNSSGSSFPVEGNYSKIGFGMRGKF